MLSCTQARRVVFDYLDGELDASTARAVEQHRDSCTNCPPLVQAILAVLAELRRQPEVDFDRGWFEEVLTAAFEAPIDGLPPQWTTNWPSDSLPRPTDKQDDQGER